MAGKDDRGSNPQPGSHPRMGAGLPAGPGGTMEQISSTVSEAAGQVRDKARETASHVAERVGDAWESTRHGAQAVAESAENFWEASTDLIRRYPIASVAIAFALGCLTPACLSACFGRADDVARGMSRASQY